MSGDYCICSACGERVLVSVFDQGAHECPYKVEPMEGESFPDYKARAERTREMLRAATYLLSPAHTAEDAAEVIRDIQKRDA